MTLPARIGITGAAGFIGANLAERLLAEGVEVVGVDDLSMGNLRNLEGMHKVGLARVTHLPLVLER